MGKLHELTGNSADSTTARQLSVSSLNKALVQDRLFTIIGKLSDIGKRGKISKKLANLLGAEKLFIFINDQELNVLLPALGFPQTLPDGKVWNDFLAQCIEKQKYQAKLPYPNKSDMQSAAGYAYKNDCVLVLLGVNAAHQGIHQLTLLLPLIASVFRYEKEINQKDTEVSISKKSVINSQGIARKLDIVRRELQMALIEKEKEIEFRKKAEKESVQVRKRAEESEKRFRTLADNIPNLAWMAKPDGYVYWYNSRWYEYTGTKPADMEGWGWQTVHDPKVLPVVLKKWKSSIESGKPFDMVFPLKGADAEFRPFLTRVVPIHDESGKIINWFGTNTDITEQKLLERQKDDFLGIASHELKTPVTSIKAYGQVLQTIFRRKGDTKAVEHLLKMDAQVNKLTALISDLLDVTKIQSGRMEFYEDLFDFNELVTEQVEQLQLTTEKHVIRKELSNAKSVYGDRERIGQVITNLVSNAIKYSPHKKKIIVKTTCDRNQITLCVRDFGVGIPSDKLDRVFEQFYRVSGAKESTFPGLGLGLYVSSEIIKREGGKIWVKSIEGKGSTFCFTLPINGRAKKRQKNSLKEFEIQHE
jgi:PAS domain S-box-containing protein